MAPQTMAGHILDRTADSDDEDDEGTNVEGVDFRRFYLIKMLVTQKNWFHYVVAGLLSINTLAMCFEADYPELEIWPYVNVVFVVIFVTELALRLITYGLPFFYNDEWRWNIFDFLIVIVACTDMILHALQHGADEEVGAVTSIRVVRMLRILRVFRLLRQFDELQLLARGLLESAEYVMWTFMLLAMLVFTCAILCTMVIWRHKEVFEDPDLIELYWGGVLTSCLTLFQFLTLDDWGTIARQVAAELPAMVCVFVPYIVMAAFVVLSLLTGVMAEHMQEVRVKEMKMRRHTREFEVKKTMRELYNVFIEHCESIGPGDLVETEEAFKSESAAGEWVREGWCWQVIYEQIEDDMEETLLLRKLDSMELLACERSGQLVTPSTSPNASPRDAQPDTVRVRERDISKLRVLDLGDTTAGVQKISKGKFVRMMQTPHVRRHLRARDLDIGFQSFSNDEVEEVFEALDTLKAGALGWDEFHEGLQQTRQSITSRQIARLQCGVSAIARRLNVKFPHMRENRESLDPSKVQQQLAKLLAHVNNAAEHWDGFSDTVRNHLDDFSAAEYTPLVNEVTPPVTPCSSRPWHPISRESSVAPLTNRGFHQLDFSKLGFVAPSLSRSNGSFRPIDAQGFVAPSLSRSNGSFRPIDAQGSVPPSLPAFGSRSPSPFSSEASLMSMRAAAHARSAPLNGGVPAWPPELALGGLAGMGPLLPPSPSWSSRAQADPGLGAPTVSRSWSSPRLAAKAPALSVSRSLSPAALAASLSSSRLAAQAFDLTPRQQLLLSRSTSQPPGQVVPLVSPAASRVSSRRSASPRDAP